MSSKAVNEPSSSNSLTLSIDLRSGSVVMQRDGLEVCRGMLPINPADTSKLATWQLQTELLPSSDDSASKRASKG